MVEPCQFTHESPAEMLQHIVTCGACGERYIDEWYVRRSALDAAVAERESDPAYLYVGSRIPRRAIEVRNDEISQLHRDVAARDALIAAKDVQLRFARNLLDTERPRIKDALEDIDAALALTPADLRARQAAERAVIEAALAIPMLRGVIRAEVAELDDFWDDLRKLYAALDALADLLTRGQETCEGCKHDAAGAAGKTIPAYWPKHTCQRPLGQAAP